MSLVKTTNSVKHVVKYVRYCLELNWSFISCSKNSIGVYH